jgi:hypothetical protein
MSGFSAWALTLAMLSAPAWAVNKCTMPDGRVVYQEASCGSDAKSVGEVKTWENSGGPGSSGSWRFERSKDELKGSVRCFVMSPEVGGFNGRIDSSNYVGLRAVVLVEAADTTFALRSAGESTSFHNDLAGMGVKSDVGAFTPLVVRAGGRTLAVVNSPAMVTELEKARSLRVRVRFWPYETLHDLDPIPMAGFRQAMKQARACAEALRR